jgi:alpha-amylase/alpha-mannosidase (GH57 family)
MSQIYLCVHGHFYQPPRENPWLGVIEAQPSAYPFRNWNERITRECYAPNARARLLGPDGRIARLINNYEYMSFNFGPTLLAWMEHSAPYTYQLLIESDRAGMKRYGHGNALAQVYNHIIMPLANTRDKITQIRWGIEDFRHRFRRNPEGMWLAETAVDLESLELMAREGIRFTLLAPNQASKIRPLGMDDREENAWKDVSGDRIDPRRPYRLFLPENRHIDIFFYDGPASRAVAFEQLLSSGDKFLKRLKLAAGSETSWPRLVNIATDGESYGHHFRFGDMALAWLFDHLEQTGELTPINYGAFLEMFPPEYEVRIFENTSWSCAHGVERWRSDCGCCASCRSGWTQEWRAPLREGLNWLSEQLADIFEKQGSELFSDPWEARNAYVNVLTAPTDETRNAFFDAYSRMPLNDDQRIAALTLLESQLMGLFMFTSCGWFFDDLAGLEPVQDLQYAARAMDLVTQLGYKDLEAGLLTHLARAKSNEDGHPDGRQIFREKVITCRMLPSEVAAHTGFKEMIHEKDLLDQSMAKMGEILYHRRFTGPALEVLIGEIQVRDVRTGRTQDRVFLSLNQGGTALSCLVGRTFTNDFHQLIQYLPPLVERSEINEIIDIFKKNSTKTDEYHLKDLLPEVQRAIVRMLAEEVMSEFRNQARDVFEAKKDVLSLFAETKEELPEIAGLLLRLDMGDQLIRLLENGHPSGLDWDLAKTLAERARVWNVSLKDPLVIRKADFFLKSRMDRLARETTTTYAQRLIDFIAWTRDLRLDLDLWGSQNTFYTLYHEKRPSSPDDLKETLKKLGWELGFSL